MTLHPFDDGNGRLTRAITDRVLAQSDNSKQRFYSMSAEILARRDDYYQVLEMTQKGDMDITQWLVWFVETLEQALLSAEKTTDKVVVRARFWQNHHQQTLNDRQQLMLNKLLTDFYGVLTVKKWAKICKCSTDVALQDINELFKKGMLNVAETSGRDTKYEIMLG